MVARGGGLRGGGETHMNGKASRIGMSLKSVGTTSRILRVCGVVFVVVLVLVKWYEWSCYNGELG